MKDQIVHSNLDKLQFCPDLNSSNFLIVKVKPAGYGAGLYYRLLGMKLGYIYNRTVLFDYSEILYPNFYQKTSSLEIGDINNFNAEKINFKKDQAARVVYFDLFSFWSNFRIRRHVEKWLPQELINQKRTPEYFLGQLLLRWQLLPEYHDKIEVYKERLNFFGPIIGIHIRRGDKVVESPYVPMRIYNYYLKKAVEESGIKRVFVTSDSDDVFSQLPDNLGVEYIYDKEEKRYNNANFQLVQDNPEIKEQEGITAAKIIYLLSNCDYIVGQENTYFTSFANITKESQGLNNRVYFVNHHLRWCDVTLNNDPNIILYLFDLFRKFGFAVIRKIFRIFWPLVKDKKFYKKIKSLYYKKKIG